MRSLPLLALFALVAFTGCGDDSAAPGATSSGSGGSGEGGEGTGAGDTSASTGAATTTASSGTGTAATFSVMTWNVESFPKTQASAEILTATIAAQLPTIAAFEEVDDVQLLEEALDAVANHDVVQQNDPPFALALAVDPTRATILDSGVIFTDEQYLFPRAPLVARVALAGSGLELDLVVVHQKAQIDEESEERRRAGNERLVQWCEQRFAGTGAPILLVGDFNDQVTDTGANDVFAAFKDASAPAYWFLTSESEDNGEYSYVPFRSFIDHQIATDDLRAAFPNAQTAVLRLDEEVANYVGRMSDHRPVRVDFSP
jgi:endonuclease/exonuclease/phosphatase family metal-dependent hydrolase